MFSANMHKSNQSIRNRLLVARLPTMPQILFKLIDFCQRDEAGMGELAKLIAHDVGMSTRILSIANGTAYNRGSRKVGLMQALNTLGIEMIKTLVISESVFQTFSNFSRTNNIDLHGFWVRSLKAAVLARELARKMSYPHSEEAYLAGLLHDVGRLALLSAAPREYSSNFMAKDDEHLCAIETSSMGITHAEAGAWLIERWNLDSFLADSVRYHHEPIARLKSAHPLIRLVCLAHLLSSYKSDSPELEGAGALCGVNDADVKAILTGVAAQTKTAAAYFGIDLTGTDQEPPSAEYEPLEPVKDRAEERLAEEVRNVALVSAAGQSFSRMRSGRELLESITRTARILFNLEDMIVLMQDAKAQVLVGVPIWEHQQRLTEFSIPLTNGGVIAESVLKRQVTFVGRDDALRGLVEEQLLRAMGTQYLIYLPMIVGQSCLGVLVGGLSSLQAEELWGRERFLQSFATQAATSLELSTAARDEIDKQIASVNEEHREASRRVAHEVNNPLSIIKNYLGVLDDKLTRHEPVIEELSILNEEIDRVSRIVGGLAGQESAQQEETTEVNSVLNDVVRLFSISRYLPSSVSIVVKTTDQPAEMLGPADPLKQILLNLIKNAVEALPNGGKIEVKNNGRVIREGRAYLELCISDSGAGIPADVLDNLFSPVHSSKSGVNRGLGLSIVQSLVKKINGLISCRSGESGTAFEILLPVPEATVHTIRKPARVANTV
jgi:HD-like signal output (HDOD) protein/nitrogen-specific signal transduction histidine kinase